MLNKIKTKILNIKNFILKNYKKILLQSLYILSIALLFFLDGFIFSLFDEINKINGFKLKYFIVAFLFALLFSISKNKKVIYFCVSIFCFFSITQLSYLAYFKIPLSHTEIQLIFTEVPDIVKSGFGEFNRVYYAFIATTIPYIAMFFLIKKYDATMLKVRYASILLVLSISIYPLKVVSTALFKKTIRSMGFNPDTSSHPIFYDGMKIYSYYLFNTLPRQYLKTNKVFREYAVEKIKTQDKINIVVVMGESFNYSNQSLYGYVIDGESGGGTTPNLNNLKNDKNFIYKKGISSATSTRISLSNFFNLQREPENINLYLYQNFNLFKMAKENGFKTYFISAWDQRTVQSIGGRKYIDFYKIDVRDDEIINRLKEVDSAFNESDKNFIVINQSACHTPYYSHYHHVKKEFDKFKNSYDNCILYIDHILNDYISYFSKKEKTYIFITSDHGENKYGHREFTPEIASVPVIFYANDADKTIMNKIKDNFAPTHAEISLLIAEMIGYKINNPNTPDNIFYVNSASEDKYMKVIKIPEKKEVKFEIIDNN
ncbi:MAG: sulfatase-like hydrolase/transferase [Rickettsiales bacterium]|jgi:glucan phosphoethanolaminetransferase (alkaline phosphatase superfamily)|nr:sulfatase-like hydrolase/transferase [Rickettsiales bacterium]